MQKWRSYCFLSWHKHNEHTKNILEDKGIAIWIIPWEQVYIKLAWTYRRTTDYACKIYSIRRCSDTTPHVKTVLGLQFCEHPVTVFQEIKFAVFVKFLKTRMHSSRMRTGRSLTVCCSLFLGGGVSALGGCLLPGGLLQWGVSAPRGRGVYPSMHWGRHPPFPPPVDRILDTRLWKYYLGPTSLRPVMRDVGVINGNK